MSSAAYRVANKERIALTDKEYRAANKLRIAAQKRQYRIANKEQIAAYRRRDRAANAAKLAARNKEWRKANKEMLTVYYRARDLKKLYGMTVEERAAISEKCQNIGCTRPITKKNALCIDHDHNTGKVRGVLCSKCNLDLGRFGDGLDQLKTNAPSWMVQYLGGTGP